MKPAFMGGLFTFKGWRFLKGSEKTLERKKGIRCLTEVGLKKEFFEIY